MDDKTVPILAGAIVLIVIILIPSLYTIEPFVSGTAATTTPATHPTAAGGNTTPQLTPTTKVTPIVINATPTVTRTPTPIPTPVSYVTLVYRQTEPTTYQPIPQPSLIEYHKPATGSEYYTLYSLKNQKAVHALPYVVYNLSSPPLIIDYTITPLNITHTIGLHYKIMSQVYDENLAINRHYEGYKFEIIVRDRDTGKIVARDGVGEEYGFESPKQLTIYKGGSYLFEFTGLYATVDLTMKVKKEGNIPS